MAFTKSWQNTIQTPIPPDTSPAAIVSILHDHGFLITLSPIVTGYEKEAQEEEESASQPPASPATAPAPPEPTTPAPATSTPTAAKISYLVRESIPLGPFSHGISFRCAFQDTARGVVSWIQAPMGLSSRAEYCVRGGGGGGEGSSEGGKGDGGGGEAVLEERIESECNFLLKGYVERTMVRTRREMHGRILERAREGAGR